jgi:hypothetical protein
MRSMLGASGHCSSQPASINLKMDSCRSSANVKKRGKKTNFLEMEITVQTLEKEHILMVFN